MARVKVKKEQLKEALEATHGQLILAAQRLRISYPTIKRYMARYPDLDAYKDELRTRVVESVENVLVDRALAGEPWAVQFLLKTWARERYGDRVQVEPSEVIVRFELSDDDRRALYEILQRAAGIDPRRVRLPEQRR